MVLKSAGVSETGTVRENNEDVFLIDNTNGIYIVCDGIGGEKGGEVASATAVKETVKYILEEKSYLEDCRQGKFSDDAIFRFVADAIRHSCRVIYEMSNENPDLHKMGTTLTMAVDMGSRILFCHVGDSRAYLINGQGCHQLSEDHTLVKDFIKKGLFKNEEEAPDYLKNILTRSLGRYPSVEVDCLLVTVTAGDRLLLCTDGLNGPLDNKTLAEIIYSEQEIYNAVGQLAENALLCDGSDNITAVLLEVQEGDIASDYEYLLETSITDLLKENALYEDLSYSDLSRMRSHTRTVCVRKNEVLVNSGEALSGYYIIIDGCISVGDKTLSAREDFGLETLLRSCYTNEDIIAVKDSRLLYFSRHRFDLYSKRYPWAANKIMRSAISKINEC